MEIDILMATYQGEAFLAKQLDSILNQSFGNWHLYVCDDGSTDGTWEILSEYAGRFPNRITVWKNSVNSGSAAANFYGMLPLVKSRYFMFADQDDIWLPKKIEATYLAMRRMEEKYGNDCPVLVHTDLAVVDETGKMLEPSLCAYQKLSGTGRTLEKQLVQNTVTGCTMMGNQSLLKCLSVIPDGTIMHDWWIALVASCFGKIGFLKTPEILYRKHGNNVEGAKDYRSISAVLSYAKKRREIQKSMAKTYRQADAFLRLYRESLSKEQSGLIMAYRSLETCGFFEKREKLIQYGFWKTGWSRKLGQLIFI